MKIIALLLALLLPTAALAQSSTTASTLSTSIIANDGSTGTTVNKLAKLTSASAAVITATTDTDTAVGIVLSNAGTTGNAQIVTQGTAKCAFDGTATAGHFVQISSTIAGDCHDSGAATRPGSGQVIGYVVTGGVGAGTYTVMLQIGSSGAGSGTVTTTGSPANGNLALFSGATSITGTTSPGTGVVTALGNATNSNGGFPTDSGVTVWTPAVTTSGTVGSPTYATNGQIGSYEKIGSTVIAWFSIQLSNWTGSPTGNVSISVLPVASGASINPNDYATCAISDYSGALSLGWITGRISVGQSSILLLQIPQTGATAANVFTAANAGTTFYIKGVCTYHT